MNYRAKVLVVDDEQAIRESLGTVLQEEKYEVDLAANGAEAIEQINKNKYDVVFCDIRMPKADGLTVLRHAVKVQPSVFFIVITAFGDMDSAISALKYGAFDYIVKPLLFDDLLIKLDHLLKYRNLMTENQVLKQEIEEKYSFDQLVGQGPEMREVYSLMREVSNTHNTLLITGERGTGKKIVAKAIHHNSPRKSNRFVGIQCGLVGEDMLEKKLFGYKDGQENYQGVFLQANKGTVFLDDIDRLSMEMQGKIYNIVHTGTLVPYGSTTSQPVDVRIIAATSVDLGDLVVQGKFHERLFDKISSCEIKMPPLRARRNDIPFLIKYFIRKYNNDLGANILFVEEEALKVLMNYSWPCNIRELANVIERALMTTQSEVFLTRDDLPLDIVKSSAVMKPCIDDIKEAMKVYETHHIKEVLAKHNNDKKDAAEALGLSLSSLYRKLEDLSIH
ncbi:MAG TPA: sigma-54 dependent transcriptional regulator [Bdellovibrionota bacterium]|nr:sigma-54 dependent transcriptional regulator [Bdellovibrionota bacterium]